MLEVKSLSAAYGSHPALNEASLTVSPGEIVVILGANGAGKSTLLRAIAGVCEGRTTGSVVLNGQALSGLSTDEIVEAGIALVPEGRGIFGDFLACVRTRERPFRDIEIAHRTASHCHLGNMAYWLKRPLKWDPEKEKIIGDDEAARWVSRPMREPWSLV